MSIRWYRRVAYFRLGVYSRTMPVMSRKPKSPYAWLDLSDEQLLDVRICDLKIRIEDTPLVDRLEELYAELERRGIQFRPYAWLSTDWFTPDGVTGFAVPFYLAHPRLLRLERRLMLEAEGSSRDECMKIMRHEAAHAIDNAYRLRRRKAWRETFGHASLPYESTYAPDPTSREHVLNLDYWYSQSHPLEDFAETFAVWLRPGSRWRARYEGWPALDKLEYVDQTMRRIGDQSPKLRTRFQIERLSSLRLTLRTHYERKRRYYMTEGNPALDGQLARVFPSTGDGKKRPRASTFLKRSRRELVRRVSQTTGQHRYLLDHVVREMIDRCQTKDLRLAAGPVDSLVTASILLTSLSSQFLYGAHPKFHR
ncbi:MAG: hypothetical protein ACI841_001943 [Planctomycetota bacterium]|jgi:hypothetical protein